MFRPLSGELVQFYDCQLKYANFEGRETQYTMAGDRFFHIEVSPADAEWLRNKGVRVNVLEDEIRSVNIRIHNDDRRPVQWIGQLNVEVVLVPWTMQGRTGVALYFNRVIP